MKNGQLINIISGKWAGRQAFYSAPRNGRQFVQLVQPNIGYAKVTPNQIEAA